MGKCVLFVRYRGGDFMICLYWLFAIAVFLIVEMFTLALTTIWFAGGGLMAFLVCLAGANLPVQFIVFFVSSIVCLFFIRPFFVKFMKVGRTKTNAQGLLGREARVIEEVDNFAGKGRVKIDGQVWAARLVEDGTIPVDSKVVIEEIQGVKLIVKKQGNL